MAVKVTSNYQTTFASAASDKRAQTSQVGGSAFVRCVNVQNRHLARNEIYSIPQSCTHSMRTNCYDSRYLHVVPSRAQNGQVPLPVNPSAACIPDIIAGLTALGIYVSFLKECNGHIISMKTLVDLYALLSLPTPGHVPGGHPECCTHILWLDRDTLSQRCGPLEIGTVMVFHGGFWKALWMAGSV